jgi:hypothetical protein
MFVQDGFLYLIVTRHKLTVRYRAQLHICLPRLMCTVLAKFYIIIGAASRKNKS